MNNFYRIACAVPECRTADISFNIGEMIKLYTEAAKNRASIVLFPSEAVSGFACGELPHFPLFARKEAEAVEQLARATAKYETIAVLTDSDGNIIVASNGSFDIADSCDTVFTNGDLRFAVSPEREAFAPAGRNRRVHLMLFPYAQFDTYHTVKERRTDYSALSRSLKCFCAACGAGASNSTSAGVCAGHALVAFDGKVTAENRQFERKSQILYSDIDIEEAETFFNRDLRFWHEDMAGVHVNIPQIKELEYCTISKYPFIPEEDTKEYSDFIILTSAAALANRMITSRSKTMVLGVSGGLDSTMALITCVECCRMMGVSEKSIVAVSMPGFGTSDRTRDNSLAIAEEFGVELKYIPISSAVTQHFEDIGHDPANTDVVYENSQARERTQILMDIANGCGGIVIGTGDLSEIALGWCTYNGDQMSMYAVNASIPKTLMRKVISCYAEKQSGKLAEKLIDICDTPVSPELVPGKQFTEEIIGSYDLHDFFIYWFIKYGAAPAKLYQMACRAFKDDYAPGQILSALEVFFRRFFVSQFKRSAMPDSPDVTGINLSSFSMPSDASGKVWNDEIEILKKQL